MKTLYDARCYDLAEAFLTDVSLSAFNRIQLCIEGHLRDIPELIRRGGEKP